MIQRRLLILLSGVFVVAFLLITAHPASREQAINIAHHGLSAVASLTKGESPAPGGNDPVDVLPPSTLGGDTEAAQDDAEESKANSKEEDDAMAAWNKALSWMTDQDLYENPKLNLEHLTQYAPHNYNGSGHKTIATLLLSRSGSLTDPYFLAAQQQVYRILWDPRSRSRYSMTVFVGPFVHEEQRRYLAAAGALVREISVIEFKPDHDTNTLAVWRDQFTKLNLWKEEDFEKILYIDIDAFPLDNIDVLLDDMSPSQHCLADFLPQETLANLDHLCNYTFTAAVDKQDELNAGMFVIKPNVAMSDYLIKGMYHDTDKYNEDQVEQGYMGYIFRSDGPFPGHYLDRSWNAYEPDNEDEGKVHILHAKLWSFTDHTDHFARTYFNDTWMDMLKLYESEEFERLRIADGLVR